MKRAVLYTRVSSVDQHPETQRCDLRPLAAARGYEIVGEYTDTISGSKAKRAVRRRAGLGVRPGGSLGEALSRNPRRLEPPQVRGSMSTGSRSSKTAAPECR
jgi:hypothetical protein